MPDNINVRFVGTANMTAMTSEFAAVKLQITALNAQLARMVDLSKGLDPRGYERMARAQTANSATMRSAAASSGMFEVQQLRVNKATDDYISKLQKQKFTMRDTIRGMRDQNSMYQKAYADQVRMQNMMARTANTSTTHGKMTVDAFIPHAISGKELNDAGKKLAFFNEHLKSSATQMVNWGKNTQWAGRQLSMGFTMPIAALGAAAGVMAYQVDQALTRVQKVYNTTAQSGMAQQKELDAVRKAGMDTAMMAAKQYGSAATDTINVQADLAAAGQVGLDLQKNTIEVMRISRLGDLDYNDAVKATISMQNIWKMSNKDLADSFNYINAVENQTSLETSDFVKAIPIAAGPVKAFGGTIEDLGTLLVAMKSHGIEAAQGANAIKAAMQRLGRPSKQVQQEWTDLTKTDITSIFDKSKGLLDLFSRINDATAQLSDKDKIKAFAGLFGTYQVTRMMAMVQGMDDLKKGIGQVTTAYDLAGKSQTQLAKIAQQEISRYQESISGQWDRAFNEIKLQLASIGGPFVQVATTIISSLSHIIGWINKLPKAAKVIGAVPILLAAIAGPIIMLVGLFGNLIGNGMKWTSWIIGKFAPAMEVMTTSQKAAALAAEQTAEAFIAEAEASDLVTMHLKQMELASALANKETRRLRFSALLSQGYDKRTAASMLRAQDATAIQSLAPGTAAAANNTQKMSRYAKMAGVSFGVSAAAMGVMALSSNETVDKIAEMVMYAGMMGPMLMPIGSNLSNGFKAATTAAAGTTGRMASLTAGASAFAGELSGATIGLGLLGGELAAAAVVWWGLNKLNDRYIDKNKEVFDKAVKANDSLVNTSANFAQNMGKAAGSYDSIMQGSLSSTGHGVGTFTGTPQSSMAYKTYQYYKNDSTGKSELSNIQGSFTSQEDMMSKLKQHYIDLMVINKMTAKQAASSIQGMMLAMGKSGGEALSIAMQLKGQLGDIKNLDWAKSIANSSSILRGEMQNTLGAIPGGTAGSASTYNKDQGLIDLPGGWEGQLADYEAGLKAVANQVKETAGIFVTAWNNSMNPKQARAAMAAFIQAALAEFQNQFQKMMANPQLAKLLSGQGIVDSKGLAKAFDAGKISFDDIKNALSTQNKQPGDVGFIDPQEAYNGLKYAQMFEGSLVHQVAISSDLSDNLTDVNALTAEAAANTKNMTFKEAQKSAKNLFKDITAAQQNLGAQKMFNNGGINQVQVDAARAALANAKSLTQAKLSAIAMSRGIAVGSTAAKTLYNIMHNVRDEAEGTKKAIDGLPSTLHITLSKPEIVSTIKDAMSATEDDMATSAQNAFNSRWDAAVASRQAMWSKRESALQQQQSNAQSALQRRQQKASDAMDKRFQKAQDAINKKYQDRIDAVNKEIKAEQDADEKRQAMYEAEKKRLQDLADMANKNIDFNSALNQGNFDEAAKIRNDMEAQSAANSLDAIEARRSAAVQKAVDRLQKKVDRLGKMRDKELKRLQNVEDAQKKHLQHMQEAQTAAQQKSQAAATAALKAREDADMASQQKTRDFEEAMLNQRLDLFKTYIAKNQKDLERWMRKVGLTYNDFGSDIKAKGESWASYFQKALHDHIIAGASQIKSDKMWAGITPKLAKTLLAGLGFKSLAAFQKFVNTGKLKQDERKRGMQTGHGGGIVGQIKNNRKGLRGANGGLHGSEQMVRAQKGEFLVNRKAAYKHRRALEYINGDARGGYSKDAKGGPSGVAPIVGYPAAMIAQGFTAGTTRAARGAMVNSRKATKALKSMGKNSTDAGFSQGVGGRHRPIAGGYGITNYHGVEDGYNAGDIAAPIGTPVFAVADGRITSSYDIKGYEARRMMYGRTGPSVQDGYASYGRVIKMAFDGGGGAVFAHLSQRYARMGQKVKGGAKIGASGNTGNVQSSSGNGAHLHFGSVPMTPYAFMRKGGTVKFDNTPAVLHRGETVLTEKLTKQFKNNVASGGNVTYDVDVAVHGSDANPNDIADAVIKKIERAERRGPTHRRNKD